MRPNRYTLTAVFFLILCLVTVPSFSQQGISFDLKKPAEYEERVLRSERSEEKKFTLYQRFIQNTVTHYNFYFNANNKLNDVLERAKSSFTDDYSLLLPFYNYSLDKTAADSIQLDSITYKSSTGIALHDLRNDWVDNLYLLWGASYYLQKKFDSAYLMFQFINYAFAPKEKDGYYLAIGSSRDGNSALSISTKEKNSLPRKVFAEPPSRNDAFIWQIRNFLAQDQFAEAASLIVTLRTDPVFPKRLHNDLEEVQALWFYKQNMWDSAAAHLINALDNATNKKEKARWEYLAAQLYELAGNYKESEKFYTKVSSHTTDPVMDIYARLFAIRVNKDEGEKTIEKNVAELVKMAKRDKYTDYRDIIYYMAAQMLLEGNNTDGAIALLLKSTQYAVSGNEAQRNKAFLQLAELSFAKKQYRPAYNFYDSLRLDDPSLKNVEALTARKEMLGRLATSFEIIDRQDSLQKIALLPEEERQDFVKKMVKQIRKQQGLKEEAPVSAGSPFATTTAPTLFPTGETKGEWYFYNAAFRTTGQNEFKNRWGNRANSDNWRRSAALVAGVNATTTTPQQDNDSKATATNQSGADVFFDGLFGNLPITPEQLKTSNDSIQQAMFVLGRIYVQEIEDCPAGTETFEELRSRFPQFEKMDEVLFNLYYCYNKNGEMAKAIAIKKLMSEKYATSNFTTIVITGKNPNSTSANTDATKTYEKIYDLFIEGNFDQAIAQKKAADAQYGKNFWTPQLLYIEAIFYIKQRDDGAATSILNSIVSQFPNTPLATKAATLLDVLSRRNQIETELRNLVVTRAEGDTAANKPLPPVVKVNPPVRDTVSIVKTTPPPVTNNNLPQKDTTVTKPLPPVATAFTYSPDAAHYVVLILNKIDPVFVNEAKNAFIRYNKDTYYNKTFTAELFELNPDNRLLLIAPYKTAQEAIDYIEKARPKTATEILPWLRGGKYSFSILSNSNFDVLKNSKDIEKYKDFINQQLPGKF
jgi:outer membrane protein assembly factor BamD (BamD/ComL family)